MRMGVTSYAAVDVVVEGDTSDFGDSIRVVDCTFEALLQEF